jgi:hypothetical protein
MLIALGAGVGCFRPDVSKLPRDRSPLPAPSWEWSPLRGEVHEFPIPPGSKWLPAEQERLTRELARTLPPGATPLVAVYECPRPWKEVVDFYSKRWGDGGKPTGSPSETVFPELELFPEVRLVAGPPVRIVLRKVLPAGVRPPEVPRQSDRSAPERSPGMRQTER